MSFHYNTKRRIIKEHSSSFYLSDEILSKIDFIAEMKNQSRSVIVDVILNYKGEQDEFSKIERKFFKKSKKAKKIHTKRQNIKNVKKTGEQKLLFTSADLQSF